MHLYRLASCTPTDLVHVFSVLVVHPNPPYSSLLTSSDSPLLLFFVLQFQNGRGMLSS